LVEDPKWELALLATVQGFYQRLLSDQLGGELPAPAELAPDVISHVEDVGSTLDRMQLWIRLLDMAITPAMLRLGVRSDLDPEVAEALLRYFARHRDDSAANRDKTDLVATFCFAILALPASGVGEATDSMVLFRCLRLKLRCWKSSRSLMFQCSRIRMCNCCVNSDPCSIRQIASMTSARSWIPASSPGFGS